MKGNGISYLMMEILFQKTGHCHRCGGRCSKGVQTACSFILMFITEDACPQFWYTKDTAETIARVVADYVGTFGRVACIACPSLYHELKVSHSEVKCDLLEYDTRFEVRAPFCLFLNPLLCFRES